jgi:cytochrome b561/polyisoprenoid-binding protein YceI
MDTNSYNRYSRWLHWIIAGLILFMVFLGWRLDPKDPHALNLYFWHKSTGILILLLSLVRIAVRVAYKAPPEPPMPQWQAWAAKTLHFLFYVVMIGMPLSGWAMVSTSAREIPFFIFHWPHMPFVPVSAELENPTHEFFENIHGLIAKLLIYGMIPLHVLAALKHQFVDKDSLLEHMVPGLKSKPVVNWRWIVPLGVVLLAVGLAEGIYRGGPQKADRAPEGSSPPAMVSAAAEAVSSVAADAPASSSSESASSSSSSAVAVTEWTVDKAASKIAFTTTFQGEAINGSFGGYTAAIAFDPAALDKSHVKVTIDLASVASGDKDRDTTLQGDSFFNVAVTPKAVFEAKSFSKRDATHFVAHGKLTLHGKTRDQDLPFSLTIKNGVADMKGSTTLDRTNFGVGSGDYASTDTIPAAVKVDITIKAKAQPQK